MIGGDKPRTSVIIIRPVSGSRTAAWEAWCGDCGPIATKAFKAKDTATKAAVKHDKEMHGGGAVIRVRQR